METTTQQTQVDTFLESLKNVKSFDELMALELPCQPPDQLLDCSNQYIQIVTNGIATMQGYNDFFNTLMTNPLSLDTFNQWINL